MVGNGGVGSGITREDIGKSPVCVNAIDEKMARFAKAQAEGDEAMRRVMSRKQQQNLGLKGPTLGSAGKVQNHRKSRTKTKS